MGEAKRRRERAASMPKVALGYVHSDTRASCFDDSREALVAHDRAHNRLLDHDHGRMSVRCGTDGLVAARNTVAAQIVQSDVDWLLWIDSDMGFAPDTLYQLLAAAHPAERPIVGALCFTSRQYAHDGMHGYRTRPQPTIYDWRTDDEGTPRFLSVPEYPVDHVIQVAATGSACILIHRTVLERIAEEMGPVWYDRTPGTDGKLLGEDISFCVRASVLEFPIHVHTGVKTTHFKQQWVGEADHWRAFVPPLATDETAVIADPSSVTAVSLRATTGLARTCAFEEATEPWLFVVDGAVRFHPGWLDHAQHVAKTFDAKVVGTNSLTDHTAGLLVERRYLDEECGGVLRPIAEMVAEATERGVYQLALGSVVEHRAAPAGRTAERTWTVPRYAIIPTHNRPARLLALVASLGQQCDGIIVLDNASDPPVDVEKLRAAACAATVMVIREPEQPPHLSRYWNVMLDACAELAPGMPPPLLAMEPYDVAILNDDAVIPAGWYDACSTGLRGHGTAVIAHTTPTRPALLTELGNDPGNRMTPHAFVIRGEAGLRADEAMRWWWFDTDLDQRARQAGGVLYVDGPRVRNSLANTTTVGPLAEQAEKDRAVFEAKWSR